MANDDFVHPEGKIQLLNGTVLDGYPLEQPEAEEGNDLELDTTGTYLVVGKSPKKAAAIPTSDEQRQKEERLFLHNAFLFLQHRNRIMSDSRMFLCPVPIRSGLAYTGTSGFERPTLGVYIEWWLSCESVTICMKDNTRWLVYLMSGSPMTGSNSCGIVNDDGKTVFESIYGFRQAWSSFMKINRRYDEAKSLYQAFTMEEVVEKLKEED